MSDQIVYVEAKASDIARLVEKMGSTVIGENEEHVKMACLALALSIEVPDLTPQALIDGVKGASEWISLFGANLDKPVDKSRMN